MLLEPVRAMADRMEAAVDAAPEGLDDEQALAFGLRAVAACVVEHAERLSGFFRVGVDTSAVRGSPLAQLAHRERTVCAHLLRRRGESGDPDWRTRLMVARAIAAFRIGLEDVRAGRVADPLAYLEEILAAR